MQGANGHDNYQKRTIPSRLKYEWSSLFCVSDFDSKAKRSFYLECAKNLLGIKDSAFMNIPE